MALVAARLRDSFKRSKFNRAFISAIEELAGRLSVQESRKGAKEREDAIKVL